jgi:predicted homoserine dehydrogenase-like protein
MYCYVVVECDDEETWLVLKEKGVPVSRNNKSALIYYPAHYLGFEALFSVYSVYCLGIPTGSSNPYPRYDVVGKAICDIPSGTKFKAVGHHHIIKELQPLIMPAKPVSSNEQLPYFMADSTTVIHDIPKGSLITGKMLKAEEDNLMWKLREEQDKFFQ